MKRRSVIVNVQAEAMQWEYVNEKERISQTRETGGKRCSDYRKRQTQDPLMIAVIIRLHTLCAPFTIRM